VRWWLYPGKAGPCKGIKKKEMRRYRKSIGSRINSIAVRRMSLLHLEKKRRIVGVSANISLRFGPSIYAAALGAGITDIPFALYSIKG
jgi:hypothetical protein